MNSSAARVTIGVLGAGVVGRTLATGWAAAGHTVVLGSRDPSSARIADALADINAASPGHAVKAAMSIDAVRTADLVVIAVPGQHVPELTGHLGDVLSGRIVIDATNDLTPAAAASDHGALLSEAGGIVYRAFNSVGWEQMAQPRFGDVASDMPYSGPDQAERSRVEAAIGDLGFRPVYLGAGPEALASVNALAKIWFQLALGQGWGRRLGLRFLDQTDDEVE